MLRKLFKKHEPGAFVPSGTYWNMKAWELLQISESGDYLPAGEGVTYYRVPVLLVLALGPVAGLAFILFLPLAVPLVALYWGARIISRIMPWRHAKQAGEEFRPAR
jgi:hypothetical protein